MSEVQKFVDYFKGVLEENKKVHTDLILKGEKVSNEHEYRKLVGLMTAFDFFLDNMEKIVAEFEKTKDQS